MTENLDHAEQLEHNQQVANKISQAHHSWNFVKNHMKLCFLEKNDEIGITPIPLVHQIVKPSFTPFNNLILKA